MFCRLKNQWQKQRDNSVIETCMWKGPNDVSRWGLLHALLLLNDLGLVSCFVSSYPFINVLLQYV